MNPSSSSSTSTRRRAVWLEARRSGIGASDVAALGNVPGAYGSPWSVWVDKVGLTPLDRQPTPSMRLGLDLEPVIAEWFHRETGLELGGEQSFVRVDGSPHHMATLDRLAFDGPEHSLPLGPVELKYSSQSLTSLPEHYRWQVQWQMHVTGLDHGWLAALTFPFGRPEFHVFELELDAELVARQVELVDRFWFDHVVPVVPPLDVDTSTATAEAIAAAWGSRHTIKIPAVAFDDVVELVDDYAELDRLHKAAGKELDHAKTMLRAVFGDADLEADGAPAPSEGTVDGELAVSWRAQTRTDVDAAAVRRDHGDRYDRTSTYRVLRLHGRYTT